VAYHNCHGHVCAYEQEEESAQPGEVLGEQRNIGYEQPVLEDDEVHDAHGVDEIAAVTCLEVYPQVPDLSTDAPKQVSFHLQEIDDYVRLGVFLSQSENCDMKVLLRIFFIISPVSF
jgi:hypothetical protein